MREYLLAGNAHPSRLFPECFSEEPPVAAITYEWRLSFSDILSYLNPTQVHFSAHSRRGISVRALAPVSPMFDGNDGAVC